MILAVLISLTLHTTPPHHGKPLHAKVPHDTAREIDYIAPIERWIDSNERLRAEQWKTGGAAIIERIHLHDKTPVYNDPRPTWFDSPFVHIRDWC